MPTAKRSQKAPISGVAIQRTPPRFNADDAVLPVLDALPQPIVIIDDSGIVRRTNAAWERSATDGGMRSPDISVGANYFDACAAPRGSEDGGTMLEVARGLREVLDGVRDRFELEYPCRGPDEVHWFAVMISACDVRGARWALVQHVNVSLQLERLATMGQMMSGFAHEVRNPLAALKMLIEELAEGDVREEHARRSCRLIERIERLVNSTLHFGRHERARREPHDAQALVRAALELVVPRLRASATRVAVEVVGQPSRALVDEAHLTQVLAILIDNALDATGDASSVRVRISGGSPGASTIAFEVHDRGPGITAEELDHIFDPFFTTKPKGTGLGLSIALKLVGENHGRLTVDTRPGGGSVFRVDVPTASAAL